MIQEDDEEDEFTPSDHFEVTVKIEEDEYHAMSLDLEEEDEDLHFPQDLENDFDEDNDRKVCFVETKDQNEDKPADRQVLSSSFICKTCLERFATKTQLEDHLKTCHLSKNDSSFPCPLNGCSKAYKKLGALPRHFRVNHRKPPFSCRDCGKGSLN